MSSQMRMVWPRPLHRKPQNEDKVTFKKSKEFKLKNKIFGETSVKKTPCLFEMSFVFTCLKDNNFNENECSEEVKTFRDCYMNAVKQDENIKLRKVNLGRSYGAYEKLIPSEINALFLKYMK